MASLLDEEVVVERRMVERTSRVMRGRVPIVMEDIVLNGRGIEQRRRVEAEEKKRIGDIT